jgi:hypothetical protein
MRAGCPCVQDAGRCHSAGGSSSQLPLGQPSSTGSAACPRRALLRRILDSTQQSRPHVYDASRGSEIASSTLQARPPAPPPPRGDCGTTAGRVRWAAPSSATALTFDEHRGLQMHSTRVATGHAALCEHAVDQSTAMMNCRVRRQTRAEATRHTAARRSTHLQRSVLTHASPQDVMTLSGSVHCQGSTVPTITRNGRKMRRTRSTRCMPSIIDSNTHRRSVGRGMKQLERAFHHPTALLQNEDPACHFRFLMEQVVLDRDPGPAIACGTFGSVHIALLSGVRVCAKVRCGALPARVRTPRFGDLFCCGEAPCVCMRCRPCARNSLHLFGFEWRVGCLRCDRAGRGALRASCGPCAPCPAPCPKLRRVLQSLAH